MSVIHLTLSDTVVILGYFALVLCIGLWFRRQQATAEQYFAGGHRVSWWLAGISHYMSGFSAFTFVVYSEIAYRYGFVAILLFWTSVPACLLGGGVFASRWRRARIITPVQFLEQRCSLQVQQLFAWSSIPAKLFEDALKIFSTSLFVSVGMGVGLKTSILLCGIVVVFYTLLGGLLALVVTDYLQFLMKALAILLLLPLAVLHIGSLTLALQSIPPQLRHPVGGPYGWLYLLSYALIVAISYNGSWSFAQKYLSVPDERSARKAACLAAVLNFVGTPIMLLPAMMGRALLPAFAARQKPQDIYVNLIFGLLPAGMIGIVVAALFSATMATVSADLNAIAGVLTKDFYQRILRPNSSEPALVRAGRTATFLLGSIIVAIGLWIAQTGRESLFQIMVTAFGVLLAPTLLPMLCALVFRRLTAAGVLCGFIAGLASGIATLGAKSLLLRYLGGGADTDYQLEGLSIFINVAVTSLAMIAASRWRPTSAEEQQRTQQFFLKLDTPISPEEKAASAQPSSQTILRLSTAGVGLLLLASGLLAKSHAARCIDDALGVIVTLSAVPYSSLFRPRRQPASPPAGMPLH